MQFGWTAIMIYILAGTFIIGLLSPFISLISLPISYIVNNMFSRIVTTIIILFFAYSAIMLPWRLDMNYKIVKIVLAILLDIVAICMFATNIMCIWKKYSSDEP